MPFSRTSDAGPEDQQCKCCSDSVKCASCDGWNDKRSSVRCQGAVPDLCASYLCDGCDTRCWGCNLPVCEEHLTRVGGHVQCNCCSLAIASSAVLDLAEALESIPEQFQQAVAKIAAEMAA